MKRRYSFENAARCSAMSKRTGKPCQAPAVRGWRVCRFHGAGGGAPKGKAHGRYKHGLFTAEALEEKRGVMEILRISKRTLGTMCESGGTA